MYKGLLLYTYINLFRNIHIFVIFIDAVKLLFYISAFRQNKHCFSFVNITLTVLEHINI